MTTKIGDWQFTGDTAYHRNGDDSIGRGRGTDDVEVTCVGSVGTDNVDASCLIPLTVLAEVLRRAGWKVQAPGVLTHLAVDGVDLLRVVVNKP